MEIPASTKRTDRGFDAKALPRYDLDPDWTIGALRIGDGDARSIELLVRWVNHFVLDRELAVKW